MSLFDEIAQESARRAFDDPSEIAPIPWELRESVTENVRNFFSSPVGAFLLAPTFGVDGVIDIMHSYPEGADSWCARHAERLELYEPRIRRAEVTIEPRGRLLSVQLEAVLVHGERTAPFEYRTTIDPHHHRSRQPRRRRQFPIHEFRNLVLAAEHLAGTMPDQAGALSGPALDPTTEHVRDAALFLGALGIEQVRQREQTDAFRALAECVDRALLRPIPAATVVQLSIDHGAETLPAGAEAEATSSRWRLVGDTHVGAYRLETPCVVTRGADRSTLEFSLRATGDAALSKVIGNHLRIYFDGEVGSALHWLSFVLNHATSAHLFPHMGDGGPAEGYPLGPILQGGMTAEQVIMPDPDAPASGMQLVHDYFLLKEKFFFVEICLDQGVWHGALDAREAHVVIDFDSPASTEHAPNLAVNCAVMVNLFQAQAEPEICPPTTTFPVRVAAETESTIYELTAVTAVPIEQSSGTPASPEGSLEHPVALPPIRRSGAAPVDPTFPYGYSTYAVVPSPNGGAAEVLLTLVRPRGKASPMRPHVLSVDLWACNGMAASTLQPGDPLVPSIGLPGDIRVRNVTAPSPYMPPLNGPLLARHALARARLPTGDAHATLKPLLASFARRSSPNATHVRANLARVQAIEALTVDPIVDATNGSHGYHVVMRVNDAAFTSPDDAALFVRVLHAALQRHAGVARFYRCTALCRTGIRLEWPPKVTT